MICIHCGKCANVCSIASIAEVYEDPVVRESVKNLDKVVVVSTSPSACAALGEEFGMPA